MKVNHRGKGFTKAILLDSSGTKNMLKSDALLKSKCLNIYISFN